MAPVDSNTSMEADSNPESDDLLEHFPNLQALEPLTGDWASTSISLLPPECITGVLSNGLTYFVQENNEPRKRAELFLVVGFGSLVEEEHERGIAHIIEHLGFSATKSYENHAIIKFLESIGAPFGACQNAYTSFDRTVYTLHIPTDKEGLVTESLTVLREFAYYTRISDDDLEKERKVVLEEWRESRNAQGRLGEQYIRELAKGSKFGDRLPIGTEEVITGVSPEVLRKFYAKWYHPARMAVVAVGDFEAGPVVQTIKDLFDIAPQDISPLPREPATPSRPVHPVPDSEGVAVASSTDPELSFAQAMVDCKRPVQPLKNVLDFRRRLTEDLFHKAMSSRLMKLVLEPKGTRDFFQVQTDTGEPIPPLNCMSLSIAPLPGRMRPALQAIAREIERVKRLGFHEAEVQRAQRAFFAEYEQDYIERDQRPSETFAESYVSLFLDERAAPGTEERAQIARTVLGSITCEEVSAVAAQYDFSKNVVVKIATPPLSVRSPMYTTWSLVTAVCNCRAPRPKVDLPHCSEVATLLDAPKLEALEQWPQDEDDVDARLRVAFEARALELSKNVKPPAVPLRPVLAPSVPKPAARRQCRAANASAGTEKDAGALVADDKTPLGEEIVLSNGLRVFLKPTDLFDDEIVMRARRWGGLSEFQHKGFWGKGTIRHEAQVAPMVAMMLGICGMPVESLQECLDGKRLDPNPPSLGPYTTQFDANASPADLEDLLTVVSLLFLAPVEAKAASRSRLGLVKLSLAAARLAEYRDPGAIFQKRLAQCITNDHPYHRSPSLWSILRLNFAQAAAIYNERASSPRDWTLVLTGKLPPSEELIPLLNRYLGCIGNPNLGPEAPLRTAEMDARKAITPIVVGFPEKSLREDVHITMIEPRGSTVITWPVNIEVVTEARSRETVQAELAEVFTVMLLARMLETRLLEVLRFGRGQLYGVQCGADFSLESRQFGKKRSGMLSVSFECDPKDADELVSATLNELQRLRNGEAAFTEVDVDNVKVRERRELEEATQKNDWWADLILDLYFARAYTVCGEDVGAALSFWWTTRAEVLQKLDAATSREALCKLLPESSPTAIVVMRPKQPWTIAGIFQSLLNLLFRRKRQIATKED